MTLYDQILLSEVCKAHNIESPDLNHLTDYFIFVIKVLRQTGNLSNPSFIKVTDINVMEVRRRYKHV